jgi:hypothetical protein
MQPGANRQTGANRNQVNSAYDYNIISNLISKYPR